MDPVRVSSTYMPLPRAITGTTGPRIWPWKKAITARATQMVQARTRVVYRPASTRVAFTRVPMSRVMTGTGRGTNRSCWLSAPMASSRAPRTKRRTESDNGIGSFLFDGTIVN